MTSIVRILAIILVICGVAAYIRLFLPHPPAAIHAGLLAAQAAILLFFVNLSMAFIFQVIKRSTVISVRTALVKLARRLIKWHIRMALAGTALIVFHAGVMLTQLGPYTGYFHSKMSTGYAALLLLTVTLAAGWLRSLRASGFRRKFHLAATFLFAGGVLVHMIL